jgi:hypothetical protein
MTALVVLGFVGYGTTLSRRLRWPIEVVPLTIVASAIVLTTMAGLVGALRPAGLLLVIGGLALLAYEVRHVRWPDPWPPRLSPGLSLFALFALAVGGWFQSAAFAGWDEFSHWGLTSRTVIETNALPTADSPVIFKDYPPGTAAFHYLLTLGAEYSEPRVYIANALLPLAAFAALTVGAGWPRSLAAFAAGYFGLFMFGRGLQALDVDPVLGSFFGCGLGAYILSSDNGRVPRAIPIAMALPLIKSVGLLLGIFIALFIVVDQLWRGFPSKRLVTLLALLALAPILASTAWKSHLKRVGASPTFVLPISPERIKNSFSAETATPRDRETITAFQRALTNEIITPLGGERNVVRQLVEDEVSHEAFANGLTVNQLLLAAATFAGIVVLIQPGFSGAWRTICVLLVLTVCGAVFGFGLLLLYLFSFSEYEGVRLASFGRYFGVYFLGASFVLFALLTAADVSGWRRAAANVAVAALVIGIVGMASHQSLSSATQGAAGLSDTRLLIKKILRDTMALTTPADRVYIVAVGTNGFEFYIARYELSPRRTNEGCFSLGSPRSEQDIWSCRESAAEWAKTLERYDFALLGHVDQRFWDEFGALIPGDRRGTLFRVVKGPETHLVAVPADN